MAFLKCMFGTSSWICEQWEERRVTGLLRDSHVMWKEYWTQNRDTYLLFCDLVTR